MSNDKITIDDLCKAAGAIPNRKPFPPAYTLENVGHAAVANYERARAEFWRLAFEWRDGPNGYGPLLGDYDKGMKIISEVESRT